MSWSTGSAGNLTVIPPVLPVPSDTERIRDLFGIKSNQLPLLRSAMAWLLDNNPDGIVTVQIYLLKAEGNFSKAEAVYSDDDYALTKADVLEFDQSQRSTGLEVLQQHYKLKLWAALSLDGYFCMEDYLHGSGSGTTGRS